jgi:hypothetical protein
MKSNTQGKKASRVTRLSDAPAGRQTMLPPEQQPDSDAAKKARTGEHHGERASPRKWKRIRKRAGELAVLERKQHGEVKKKHLRRAKRELLGLQTMPDPDDPVATLNRAETVARNLKLRRAIR